MKEKWRKKGTSRKTNEYNKSRSDTISGNWSPNLFCRWIKNLVILSLLSYFLRPHKHIHNLRHFLSFLFPLFGLDIGESWPPYLEEEEIGHAPHRRVNLKSCAYRDVSALSTKRRAMQPFSSAHTALFTSHKLRSQISTLASRLTRIIMKKTRNSDILPNLRTDSPDLLITAKRGANIITRLTVSRRRKRTCSDERQN